MTSSSNPGPRRAQLERGLSEVRERIELACGDAGRDPDEITLVVVTKNFPVSDVLLLRDLGVRHVGENRDQEAADKVSQMRAQVAPPPIVHFIGRLQSNKAAHVAAYADVVQSVDRHKLLPGLARGAEQAGRRLDVLVQVSLDGDTSRGGVDVGRAAALGDAVDEREALRLKGVMAVAPMGADPDEMFARLREVASGIQADHPEAGWVSAGMSSDLEAGVRHGATHLRVGSAILGSRSPLL